MAAEYSRELSAKVKFAKDNIARKGYYVGGTLIYGIQRVAVSHDGQRKIILSNGEWKVASSDRIILQPGPPQEVETVQQIFRWYGEEDINTTDIANKLNKLGIFWKNGREWNAQVVRRILICEKYIGCLITNKTKGAVSLTKQLDPKSDYYNPREQWIVVKDAFEKTIDDNLFHRVGLKLGRKFKNYSNDEILAEFRNLFKLHGRLSYKIFRSSTNLPCSNTIGKRFGSFYNVYKLVGYEPDAICKAATLAGDTVKTTIRAMNSLRNICEAAQIPVRLANDKQRFRKRILEIEKLRISFTVCRWSWWHSLNKEKVRWAKIGYRSILSDFVVLIEFDKENCKIVNYYLIPSKKLCWRTLSFKPRKFSSYRCASINAVYRQLVGAIEVQKNSMKAETIDEAIDRECRQILKNSAFKYIFPEN